MHALRPRSILASRLLREVLSSLALIGLIACQREQVLRVKDGRTYRESVIVPEAYAAYARGRLNESRGNDAAAVVAYERVLKWDGQAAEAWIRLGALQCRTNPKAAERNWQQASELAAGSYKLWFERARCALERGELSEAKDFARQALELGPSQPEVTLLCASIASRLGNPEYEARLLFGALAVRPGNTALLTAISTSPTLALAYRRYAARRLLRLQPIDEAWVPPVYIEKAQLRPVQKLSAERLQEQFEQALSQHQTDEALRMAALLGVRPDQLAFTALLWGFDSLAAKQANMLLALDPGDASAWLIALLAADLAGSTQNFDELLAHAQQSSGKLAPALLEALFALIERRTPPVVR